MNESHIFECEKEETKKKGRKIQSKEKRIQSMES